MFCADSARVLFPIKHVKNPGEKLQYNDEVDFRVSWPNSNANTDAVTDATTDVSNRRRTCYCKSANEAPASAYKRLDT